MKDIFTPPITTRGLLASRAFNRVYTMPADAWDTELGYIFSIIYLYGGEIRGMYPAVSKKPSKKWQGVLGYLPVPWLAFEFHNKPFITTKNEVSIFKAELKKLGYDFPHPYQYLTNVGEQARAVIDPLLQKDTKTSDFVLWNKQQQKWKKMLSQWHTLFYKTYKKKFDFELKLYDYKTHVAITIKDDCIDSITKKSEIIARQQKHSELLKDFAAFLYDGFLNKKKGFGKCLYE